MVRKITPHLEPRAPRAQDLRVPRDPSDTRTPETVLDLCTLSTRPHGCTSKEPAEQLDIQILEFLLMQDAVRVESRSLVPLQGPLPVGPHNQAHPQVS
jgi:hypothetical protein